MRGEQVVQNVFRLAGRRSITLASRAGGRTSTVTSNIIHHHSNPPGSLFVNIAGGTPTVSGNDFFGIAGVSLQTGPDTEPKYVNPGFAAAAAWNSVPQRQPHRHAAVSCVRVQPAMSVAMSGNCY